MRVVGSIFRKVPVQSLMLGFLLIAGYPLLAAGTPSRPALHIIEINSTDRSFDMEVSGSRSMDGSFAVLAVAVNSETNMVRTKDIALEQTAEPPTGYVQGCPLMLGDIPVNIFVTRTGRQLSLQLMPVKDRACLQAKAVRLVSPKGKRLKPKGKASKPIVIGIGVGRGSGGSVSSGSATIIGGGPADSGTGPENLTFTFSKGLPRAPLGPGWTWRITGFDGCREKKTELRVAVDRLIACKRQPRDQNTK